jgi:hypothetical protein
MMVLRTKRLDFMVLRRNYGVGRKAKDKASRDLDVMIMSKCRLHKVTDPPAVSVPRQVPHTLHAALNSRTSCLPAK